MACKLSLRSASLLMLCALSAVLAAEPAYVTDQLRLGMHEAPDTSDRPFRMLLSGEQVEVLERTRFYARVRANDGAVGWVKAGFLVKDRPAVLRVAEVEAKEEELDAQLVKIVEERDAASERISELNSELENTRTDLGGSRAENERLVQENNEYRARFDRPSVPLTWALGGALFTLFAGFLLGLLWVDHQSRKRHGGIRVY